MHTHILLKRKYKREGDRSHMHSCTLLPHETTTTFFLALSQMIRPCLGGFRLQEPTHTHTWDPKIQDVFKYTDMWAQDI